MIFNVPQPKPRKTGENGCLSDSCKDDGSRTLEVPVSKEMIGNLNVGDTVTFCVTGTITTLETKEGDTWDPGSEVRLQLSKVESDLEPNEFSEIADA